ncbi:carboxypeptidase Y inhibitor [Knufia obscura]|uniref:Carboxypeptidase Y inhibitor n=2 Tax=Knufia TaxID=430999 RepID=A0AAN8ELK9_9EURO|nr:carboxypeptidase Y inhibitor [Knufia obscura]KAK5958604.1 carboxypeptidase Y inhibitor [Knufia fluminis]
MYQIQRFVALSTLAGALAHPNVLPKYQQEIIQPTPGVDNNNNIHFQSTIRDVLLANQIIPQVLDDFEPTYYLDLTYEKEHERVLMGNDIPPSSVSERPVFTFHPLAGPPDYGDQPNDKNLTFTLALTDPDALSRKHPVKSEMCHWIVTNLTSPLGGEETEWPRLTDIFEKFEHLIEDEFDLELDGSIMGAKPGELETYQPPTPPKKTGPHRYVFVLLEGDASSLKAPKERPHWGYGKERHGVRDWSKENDLKVVGANFFFAQHKKQ